MNELVVTSAQYCADILQGNGNASINAVIDGETLSVPMDNNNRHYQAILDWVAEGNTIADAD